MNSIGLTHSIALHLCMNVMTMALDFLYSSADNYATL